MPYDNDVLTYSSNFSFNSLPKGLYIDRTGHFVNVAHSKHAVSNTNGKSIWKIKSLDLECKVLDIHTYQVLLINSLFRSYNQLLIQTFIHSFTAPKQHSTPMHKNSQSKPGTLEQFSRIHIRRMSVCSQKNTTGNHENTTHFAMAC